MKKRLLKKQIKKMTDPYYWLSMGYVWYLKNSEIIKTQYKRKFGIDSLYAHVQFTQINFLHTIIGCPRQSKIIIDHIEDQFIQSEWFLCEKIELELSLGEINEAQKTLLEIQKNQYKHYHYSHDELQDFCNGKEFPKWTSKETNWVTEMLSQKTNHDDDHLRTKLSTLFYSTKNQTKDKFTKSISKFIKSNGLDVCNPLFWFLFATSPKKNETIFLIIKENFENRNSNKNGFTIVYRTEPYIDIYLNC